MLESMLSTWSNWTPTGLSWNPDGFYSRQKIGWVTTKKKLSKIHLDSRWIHGVHLEFTWNLWGRVKSSPSALVHMRGRLSSWALVLAHGDVARVAVIVLRHPFMSSFVIMLHHRVSSCHIVVLRRCFMSLFRVVICCHVALLFHIVMCHCRVVSLTVTWHLLGATSSPRLVLVRRCSFFW